MECVKVDGDGLTLKQRRRATGLCVECGIQALPTGKITLQQAKALAEQPYNLALKRPKTWQMFYYISYCQTHRDAEVASKEKMDEQRKAKSRRRTERSMQRRQQAADRKAAGKCPRCGSDDVPEGYTTCGACRENFRLKAGRKKKRDAERIAAGKCIKCNKVNPSKFKTCPACRAIKMEDARIKKENKARLDADRKAREKAREEARAAAGG